MRRLVIGLVLGSAFGLALPVLAGSPQVGPDPHGCAALVTHTLQQYDRAFRAHQGLYAGKVLHAQVLLSKVDAAWPEFWVLAQRCSPEH